MAAPRVLAAEAGDCHSKHGASIGTPWRVNSRSSTHLLHHLFLLLLVVVSPAAATTPAAPSIFSGGNATDTINATPTTSPGTTTGVQPADTPAPGQNQTTAAMPNATTPTPPSPSPAPSRNETGTAAQNNTTAAPPSPPPSQNETAQNSTAPTPQPPLPSQNETASGASNETLPPTPPSPAPSQNATATAAQNQTTAAPQPPLSSQNETGSSAPNQTTTDVATSAPTPAPPSQNDTAAPPAGDANGGTEEPAPTPSPSSTPTPPDAPVDNSTNITPTTDATTTGGAEVTPTGATDASRGDTPAPGGGEPPPADGVVFLKLTYASAFDVFSSADFRAKIARAAGAGADGTPLVNVGDVNVTMVCRAVNTIVDYTSCKVGDAVPARRAAATLNEEATFVEFTVDGDDADAADAAVAQIAEQAAGGACEGTNLGQEGLCPVAGTSLTQSDTSGVPNERVIERVVESPVSDDDGIDVAVWILVVAVVVCCLVVVYQAVNAASVQHRNSQDIWGLGDCKEPTEVYRSVQAAELPEQGGFPFMALRTPEAQSL